MPSLVSPVQDPLFSLQSPSSVRDKKPWRNYWPPAQGSRGGGSRKWTVCRHLLEQLKLDFRSKSTLPLAERRLSCHHHVNDSLRWRHASRSVCHRLEALTYYCNLHKTKTSVESAAGCSHTELVLTMLTISFVSECRLWKARLTTVWHRFQANTYSNKSGARLFWVYWGKRILWPFLPRVLGKF